MAFRIINGGSVKLGNGVKVSIGFSSSNDLPALPSGSFYFVLNSDSTTSAGILDSSGNLIRTLWNNVDYPAGTHTGSWDGLTDASGSTTGSIQPVIISSNIQYEWDATIGNSSVPPTGSNKFRALRSIWDIEEYGNYIYVCTGFVEGNTPIWKILKSDISYKTDVRPTSNHDVVFETNYITKDISRMYFAGFDAYGTVSCAIYALTMSNEADFTFISGSTVKPALADQTYSAIGVVSNNSAARITGLAAMYTGSYLYSTHRSQSLTKIYNKVSGQLLSSSSLALGDIAIEGGYLYGISGSNVVKYSINTSTGALTATNVSMSFTNPIRLTVKNDVVAVIDEGTSQIKAYNNSGSLLWTLGQSGGYLNSPWAANDKFHFIDSTDLVPRGSVYLQDNGYLWVGDNGNNRYLRFDATQSYVDYFSYLPTNYNCGVNINNPNRVFAEFLEFDSINGEFVANWEANLWGSSSAFIQYDRRSVFRNVWDISGSTYATIDNYTGGDRFPEVVELTNTGIRPTGIQWDLYSLDVIEPNGDIISFPYNESTTGTQNILRYPSTGKNGSNNPTWGTAQTVSSVPLRANTPTQYNSSRPSSYGVIYSPDWNNSGSHFGRIVNGVWKWITSYSTYAGYNGPFPTNGFFDIDNGIQSFGGYAGADTYTTGSLTVWNYIGEGWKNNQVNKWNLYHLDYGLMLKQIGKTGPESEASSSTQDAPIEAAGNAFAGRLVKSGSDYYIYHNDESRHGAIHRFKITGTDTINVQTPTIY